MNSKEFVEIFLKLSYLRSATMFLKYDLGEKKNQNNFCCDRFSGMQDSISESRD